MKKSIILLLFLVGIQVLTQAQLAKSQGILTGNVVDEKGKHLPGANVELSLMADSTLFQIQVSDKNGEFSFSNIQFGYYRLTISYVGAKTLKMDSIYFRADRYDFNLSDLTLRFDEGEDLESVVVYAEKPLIESKDGNLTFNAGESALSAGSTAGELLASVPLVAKDPDGKITIRGKEPKILIDDKPVDLTLEQLQDLLESMPGSSIEKIEVMMNPPQEYANETGGVINITTKKGRVGVSGRLSVTASTRGEKNANGNFAYRKNKIALNINGGVSTTYAPGEGYSIRNNQYKDSSNYFNTTNKTLNQSVRPNVRMKLDYEFNKNNLLTATFNFSQSHSDNDNKTEYQNINRNGDLWKLSNRHIQSQGEWMRPDVNIAYTAKFKDGDKLRLTFIYGKNFNENERSFYQAFQNPLDPSIINSDSTQQQINESTNSNISYRLNYDKVLLKNKTSLSVGAVYSHYISDVDVDASYWNKVQNGWLPMELLSNAFVFDQALKHGRIGLRHQFKQGFHITSGTTVERTNILFNLKKENKELTNDYVSWLPYFTLVRNWEHLLSLTVSYKKSMNRPNVSHLNPTVDFSDPYNIRFGNIHLLPAKVHAFDVIVGRTEKEFYANLGLGHNIVEDVFGQIRTLKEDGITEITWENISGRKEWEVSTWSGISFSPKFKSNLSASYTYSVYSQYDRTERNFRNGGSFNSNINATWVPSQLWNVNGSFTVNRFANPQGVSLWGYNMHIGVQRKFFNKKLIITASTTDPFANQNRKSYTYGKNFTVESYRLTRTRNFKLTVAYNFVKTAKPSKKDKAPDLNQIKKLKTS